MHALWPIGIMNQFIIIKMYFSMLVEDLSLYDSKWHL